ncbi:MAG TPA: hypothetical protein VHM90_18975, partial [Phycisphaerae bacterium]|nr:hypothetical protein [Phycisphaerae bacterium]
YFTDEEWTVIQPKLQRVIDAQTPLRNLTANTGRTGGGRGGGGGGGRGGTNNLTSVDPLTFAMADLTNALQDPNTPENLLAAKLSALRNAREAANVTLKNAQADLTRVLTIRQEAILVTLGYLE